MVIVWCLLLLCCKYSFTGDFICAALRLFCCVVLKSFTWCHMLHTHWHHFTCCCHLLHQLLLCCCHIRFYCVTFRTPLLHNKTSLEWRDLFVICYLMFHGRADCGPVSVLVGSDVCQCGESLSVSSQSSLTWPSTLRTRFYLNPPLMILIQSEHKCLLKQREVKTPAVMNYLEGKVSHRKKVFVGGI